MVQPGEESPAIGKTVLQLKNIKKNHNFTCIANSEQGTIEANTSVHIDGILDRPRVSQPESKGSSAGADLPQPPRNLKITEVTSSSMMLSWHAGGFDEPVKYYVVQYKPRDSAQGYSEVSGITTTSHTVTNLKPYMLYEFQVLSVNDRGRGLPSDVAEMTTLEAEPGSAPRNVRTKALSSTSLSVEWDAPLAPNGQIVVNSIHLIHTSVC